MTHRDEGHDADEYYHGKVEETGEQRKVKHVVVITYSLKWACYDEMKGIWEKDRLSGHWAGQK